MNAEKKTKFRIIPGYAYLPLIVTVILHMTVYLGTKLINRGFIHHQLITVFDEIIPFAPEWVLIYVLTFILWGAGLISAAWQEEELCYRLFAAAGISYLICAVCFIALPTVIVRPEITGNSYCETLVAATYGFDVPTNLFPSMHCMMSYVIFRGITLSPMYSKGYSWAIGILTLLICASTVFIRQHFFVDAVAGIFFGEAALQTALRTNLWTVFKKLNKKLLKIGD